MCHLSIVLIDVAHRQVIWLRTCFAAIPNAKMLPNFTIVFVRFVISG